MTADNSRAAAIARAVLANSDYATPPSLDALTYGAIAVLHGEADRRGITPHALYAEQMAEARARHDQAVADAAAADQVAALAVKVRGGR